MIAVHYSEYTMVGSSTEENQMNPVGQSCLDVITILNKCCVDTEVSYWPPSPTPKAFYAGRTHILLMVSVWQLKVFGRLTTHLVHFKPHRLSDTSKLCCEVHKLGQGVYLHFLRKLSQNCGAFSKYRLMFSLSKIVEPLLDNGFVFQTSTSCPVDRKPFQAIYKTDPLGSWTKVEILFLEFFSLS